MRPLVLSEEIRKAVRQVTKFAETNLYYPDKSETCPGDDPRHAIIIPMQYRCVFSITVDPGGHRWRHLSISVPRKDRYPNPVAAFTIADLFGFTGYKLEEKAHEPPSDWVFQIHNSENCVVLAQFYDHTRTDT